MEDLTKGSIPKHLIKLAVPMAIGMLVHTLYLMIDLYFVGQLGETSLAGVSAAANISMFVLALTQMLNVGTATLISHAVGRKDQDDANVLFNQSLLISALMTALMLAIGYSLTTSYMQIMSMDSSVKSEGAQYLYFFLPSLALQFSIVAMTAAMRGTGIVKPAMQVQMLSLLVNIVLTPILIHGWLTGYAMGVAGAGLASSLSALFAVLMLWRYFKRMTQYVTVDKALLTPNLDTWKRLFKVGFPAGAEFLLMFTYMALVYWAIQGFGASATAGFGLGSRVMQALLLPAMAIAFALPAVAGQNFGAQLPHRVKDAFRYALFISCGLMAGLTALCLWQPDLLLGGFSSDAGVLAVSAGFLGIICFNFIPSGIIFSCSGTFQGVGNTWPSLWSSATRLVTFAVPLMWLTSQPDFYVEQVWYLSVATVCVQTCLSLFLVRRILR
ncbi:MATE family efflux transporter [Marisediminitalea sp.]|jgi:putative MATE family efflux protein|uniref:MATE family efflux transporter n=1 Tax=Marisediminitalea sp. TaxID=2662268 RepID=UPI002439DD49|nr:MATE family efflux transporter [Aestuariibacter sp.]MCP5011955.1 MATE family efflux transporter [Aestuariibacter sp.]|tara:strand:+ start:1569 stop:2891 length:1323 start_codon:yes stop_codon:yes gene_type:complete